MQHFLWIDTETTGLDPEKHSLIEIAAVVTDDKFQEVAEPFQRILWPATDTKYWDPWCLVQHTKSGLFPACEKEGIQSYDVLNEVVNWATTTHSALHIDTKEIMVAGSSVHFDMSFIHRKWPTISKWMKENLSHRAFDVSVLRTAFKLVPGLVDKFGLKASGEDARHRALDDIRQDIRDAKKIVEFMQDASNERCQK